MKKVKVTQVYRHAFPSVGGIEAVMKQISESLPTEEFEQEIITCCNTEKSSIQNGVKINRNKYLFEFASNPISLSFIWELSKVNTDVLHYHMSFIFGVISHFIARPKYKKLAVTYHMDVVGYEKIMAPFWNLYDRFLDETDVIHVLSSQIIDNSPVLKKHKDKCVVIPYGVECPKYEVFDKPLREKYKNKKILFSAGRLAKYKGFIYAIEAMKKVTDNCILLIAGDGPLKNDLQNYININNLNKKVKLLGQITDEELDLYYKNCDVFILPSIMTSEAFGIVQLEAMRFAKPVINTNLKTGVNYVSVNNETGLTVEPKNAQELADAIKLLINDDELRLKLGQNAKNRVIELFEISKIRGKYSYFYRELVKND